MLKQKGQISTEYIILIGFLLAMMVPLSLVAFDSYSESEDSFRIKQAEQAANAIVREAETVYYQGPPSMSNLKVFFPSGIFEIQVSGSELVFRMNTQNGIDDVVIPARVNLSGTITKTQGTHIINIQTTGETVELKE